MGCDIHCYIEYKMPEEKRFNAFGGRINPGRYYELFDALAGVMNYDEVTPVAELRGYPDDCGYEAYSDNWLYISEDNGDHTCTNQQARRWVESGDSKYEDADAKRVSNPDWHSHSWLTTDEYAKAIDGTTAPKYLAILAAMRSFEAQGCISRLVFWFDN